MASFARLRLGGTWCCVALVGMLVAQAISAPVSDRGGDTQGAASYRDFDVRKIEIQQFRDEVANILKRDRALSSAVGGAVNREKLARSLKAAARPDVVPGPPVSSVALMDTAEDNEHDNPDDSLTTSARQRRSGAVVSVQAKPLSETGVSPAVAMAGPLEFNAADPRAVCELGHAAKSPCVTPSTPVVPLLVTGVGRSGTHHTTSQLSALGIRVCHEELCADGSVSWPYAVVDADEDYPWETRRHHLSDTRFANVFHIVRHPLKAIASLTTFRKASWHFIGKHTPSVPGLATIEPVIKRALIHWVTWNRHIERYADWTFRMEDTDVSEICLRAGFSTEQCESDIPETPKSSRRHREIDWKLLDLLAPEWAEQARQLAIHYGYELESADDPAGYDEEEEETAEED